MKPWLVIALVTAGLAIGIAELGARLMGFGHPLLYRASPAGYELVTSQTASRLGKTTHINALGTRGPGTTGQPTSGVYRILVLGDSVANGGSQINDEQTWPILLQSRLRAQGQRVEVLNASAGGWAVQNEAAWLREHGTLGARLIVLEINERDLDQPFAGSETLDANPSFPSHYPPSALGELLTRYALPRLGIGSRGADPGSVAGSFQATNALSVIEAVGAILSQARADGARLAILYWDIRTPAPAQAAEARERLFAYLAAKHIPITRPNLNKDGTSTALFRDDIHPNAEGNQAIADLLARNRL